jgi:hypothetical protein
LLTAKFRLQKNAVSGEDKRVAGHRKAEELVAIKEIGVEVNKEKTKSMVTFGDQNERQNTT